MIHDEEIGFAYAGANGRAPGKVMVLWSMCHFPGPGDGVTDDGYTYVIRWKFFNDGRLRAEVGATGGLQHLNISKDKRRGLYVGKANNGDKVFAPSHVHNFYFRVDLDIETAEGNTAQEINYVNDKKDSLKSQAVWENVDRERGRYHNGRTFRSWRVLNPNSLNAQGHPRSYQLLPSSSGSWRDGSRYDVLKPDILFTKYREQEFPYSSEDATRALPAIEKYMNKEKLIEQDIVAWYRVAFMHHPRSEDWPAQPIVWHGFDLIPRDFLDRSPLQAEK
jgi:primary-amine oxidase